MPTFTYEDAVSNSSKGFSFEEASSATLAQPAPEPSKTDLPPQEIVKYGDPIVDQSVNKEPSGPALPMSEELSKIPPAEMKANEAVQGNGDAFGIVPKLLDRAGSGAVGLLADIGTAEDNSEKPYAERFQNMIAGLNGDKQPIQTTMEGIKSPAISFPYKVSSGMLETAPKLASVMMSGPVAPITAGYLFGYDEKGNFKPANAVVAAALPIVGKWGGSVAQGVGEQLGVSSDTALKWINAGGRYATGNAVIAAQQAMEIAPEWKQMSTDEKKQALSDGAANMLVNGLLSLGDFHFDKAGATPEIDAAARRNLSIRNAPAELAKLPELADKADDIAPIAPLTAQALKSTAENVPTPKTEEIKPNENDTTQSTGQETKSTETSSETNASDETQSGRPYPAPSDEPAQGQNNDGSLDAAQRLIDLKAIDNPTPEQISERDALQSKSDAAKKADWGAGFAALKAEVPTAKADEPATFKPATLDMPHDIVHEIKDNFGTIRSKKYAKAGNEDFYNSDAYKQAQKAFPEMFTKTGQHPDNVVQGLQDSGAFQKTATVDDLWDAMNQAKGARRAFSQGQLPEQKSNKFATAMDEALKSRKSQKLSVGDLSVGDKFTLKGEPFEVKHIDPDTGEVQVKDGKKFGAQTIPDGADIAVDAGSHEKSGNSISWEDAIATPEPPKLRTGEKQGDVFANQTEDFALASEKASDGERIAKAIDDAAKAKTEADALAEKQQGKLVGMGGAIPSEFENSPKTPTGIKNEMVDLERARRGLPPAIEPARRDFGQVWDRAMAKIDANPEVQDTLIESLREHPRALTDEENAMLLHRQIDLQNEYGKATRDLAQAHDDGRTEDVQEQKVRIAGLSDKLKDIYDIGKRVGTETGRGLNARKMMANEDFSLAKMELETRAAKGGRQLTDDERTKLQDLHDKIAETQQRFDEHVAKSNERIRQLETEKAIAEAQKENVIDPVVKRIVDRIGTSLHTQAELARARIKSRMGRVSAGIDPTMLADYAIIGAEHIFNGAQKLAAWSEKMVSDFGDEIKPHLDAIFAASEKHFNDTVDKTAGTKSKEAKKAVKDMTSDERQTDLTNKISEKFKAGKKDEITPLVQKLARVFVGKGITERETLIDAVHNQLQKIDPDIDRRETMDMISGYGDYKQLSKDQISVQLRDLKGQMQQVAKLDDMQAGQPPIKTGVERRIPSAEESRLIKAVNDAKREFQIPVSDPNTQLKSSLDMLKKRMETRTQELRDKLANQDFTTKPKTEIKLDAEAMKLKAENEKVKLDYRKGLTLDRLAKRTPFEKMQDTLVKWRRGFILSSPITLGKLTSAAFERMGFSALEEGVGGGISKLIPSVASKAPREGGLNVNAEAKAITEGFMKGTKDAWDTLRTGHSELDLLYGKPDLLPRTAIDFFGSIHGALKSQTKRNEFTRSFEKRAAFAMKNGVDVTDPMVQTRIAAEAYKDSQRAIFMSDNRVVNAYKRGMTALEQPDKATGETPVSSKAIATAGRVLLPIVKVPTNIVAETMQYATGSITGSVRLANAFRKGVETLKPEQADLIMRELKKGSIGAAALMLGFLNPTNIGGYYQAGEKRDKKDVKAGSIELFGHQLPSWLIHNPLLETLQIGATVRRVADSKLKKSDTEKQGVGAGVMAAGLGLTQEVPFVREMGEISKAYDPHSRGAFFGELTKSIAIPQIVQWAAQQTDKKDAFSPNEDATKRKPSGVLQHIETGIPGLREKVPADKKK